MTSNWLDLVQTKTIEMVLAPIASQVSLVIIMSEACPEEKQMIKTASNLEGDARSVMKATEHLANMALQVAKQSNDENLIQKMPEACENLIVAGKHLLLAAQKLYRETWKQEAWQDLVSVTKDILMNTAKVLLLCDNAEITKVLVAAGDVISALELLDTSQNMPDLLTNMKNFVDKMQKFATFTTRRQHELAHPGCREKLHIGMKSLHETIPMLNTALKTFVKYPQNIQAKDSKNQLISKMQGIVHDITRIVEWRPSQDSDNTFNEELEKPGYFVLQLEQAIGYLLEEWRPILDKEFDCVVENLVRHSMSVAHISDEYYRDIIVKNCRQILELKSVLSERSLGIQDNPNFTQLRADFDESCEEMIEALKSLETNIKLSLTRLVVDVFKETGAPLESLLKATLKVDQTEIHSYLFQENIIEPYITSFDQHSDSMYQVANFIAASSTDIKRVESLKSSIKQLELLDLDILPTVLSCMQLDKASLHNLSLLRKQWMLEVNNLLDMVDELIDSHTFLNISGICMKEEFRQCKNAVYNQDDITVAETARSFLCQAKRVSQVILRYVNNSDDPIFRNGLLVYINELDKAMKIFKVAVSKLLEEMTNSTAYSKLKKKAQHLLSCVDKVRLGLDGANHVDILNPLRLNVRSSTRLKTSGLDSEGETDETDKQSSPELAHWFLRSEPINLRIKLSPKMNRVSLNNSKNETREFSSFKSYPKRSDTKPNGHMTNEELEIIPITRVKSYVEDPGHHFLQKSILTEIPTNKHSRSLVTAAWFLQQETAKWDEKKNAIVQAAKEMSNHMTNMAEFSKGIGPITNKRDMIETAKAITKNGETIVKFANTIAKLCVDDRFKKDLLFHAEHISTFNTQLSIICNVKLATPDDRATDSMLVKNAENLMKAVTQTLKIAQVACVRGLNLSGSSNPDDDAEALAIEWKRKLQDRYSSRSNCSLNELGLRVVPPSEYW